MTGVIYIPRWQNSNHIRNPSLLSLSSNPSPNPNLTPRAYALGRCVWLALRLFCPRSQSQGYQSQG